MKESDIVQIMGVRIVNLTRENAIHTLLGYIENPFRRTHAVSIVNAHTLNLATTEPGFREVLNNSDIVLGDGTGVRWAARQRGTEMKSNLVGTDLIPELFSCAAGQGFRYFLLGAEESSNLHAAEYCRKNFPGWELVGHNHGFFPERELDGVISKINSAKPDVLLVGLGNPLQEQWIHANKKALNVPVCIGVGGLFNHWAGEIRRAPLWVRKLGIEWLQILIQQPHKWRRYLLGNVVFLIRTRRNVRKDMVETELVT